MERETEQQRTGGSLPKSLRLRKGVFIACNQSIFLRGWRDTTGGRRQSVAFIAALFTKDLRPLRNNCSNRSCSISVWTSLERPFL